MASLIDFFSGYDQVELDAKSRDLTGFQTPIGLLRMTTLPQGATNSVAQFVRIVTKILEDLIPTECLPFLDDIGVKGPLSTYDGKETLPGIRQFVLEHIQSLDKTLIRRLGYNTRYRVSIRIDTCIVRYRYLSIRIAILSELIVIIYKLKGFLSLVKSIVLIVLFKRLENTIQ
jgi:hypothetical protein